MTDEASRIHSCALISEWDGLGARDHLGESRAVHVARRAVAARDRSACADEVVEDQELHDCERVGAVQLGADRELAEALLPEVPREVHALPDRLFDPLSALVADAAR